MARPDCSSQASVISIINCVHSPFNATTIYGAELQSYCPRRGHVTSTVDLSRQQVTASDEARARWIWSAGNWYGINRRHSNDSFEGNSTDLIIGGNYYPELPAFAGELILKNCELIDGDQSVCLGLIRFKILDVDLVKVTATTVAQHLLRLTVCAMQISSESAYSFRNVNKS